MFGILNINKPPGMSSRQAVDRVARLVRPAKAGHAGTLDPLAQGVLVVCVGPATRLIADIQQMPKRYLGTFQLGCTSPTEDVEGEVTPLENPPVPTRPQIEEAAGRFVGTIEQRPPAFSALKVEGQRAYKLARRGEELELAPRTIEIHALQVAQYDYPELVLDITCGSGTYVRSLGRDLALALGTGAVMSALTRLAIGDFSLDEALLPDVLSSENVAKLLLSPLRAVPHLPIWNLSSQQITEVAHGRLIQGRPERGEPEHGRPETAGEEAAAVDSEGNLVAILGRVTGDQWRPSRNFIAAG